MRKEEKKYLYDLWYVETLTVITIHLPDSDAENRGT